MRFGSRRCALMLGALIVGAFRPCIPAAAAAAPQRPRSPLAGVTELDRPVTYTETKIPLGELVAKIAADGGVKLSASREVADEPVAVVVKDLPARELLEELANLLDYKWTRRGKNNNWRYEIWQDLAAKQREEALRQAWAAAIERQFLQQIDACRELSRLSAAQTQALVDDYQKRMTGLMLLSPEQRDAVLGTPEMQEAFQKSVLAQQLSTPLSRVLAGVIGGLTLRHLQQVSDARTLVFSTDPQPGELPLPAALVDRLRKIPPTPPSRAGQDGQPGEEQEIGAQDRVMQDHWSNATGYQVLVNIREGSAGGLGRLTGNVTVSPLLPGYDFSGILGFWDSSISLASEGHSLPNPWLEGAQRRLEQGAGDEIFGARRPFKPLAPQHVDAAGPGTGCGWHLRNLLPDIARTYGVSLIAHAYGDGPVIQPGQLGFSEPPSLEALLQQIAGRDYQWDRHDRLVRLRAQRWFLERPREIPLRLLRRWEQMARHETAWPLDEYLKMATDLSDSQIESLDGFIHRPVFAPVLAELDTVRWHTPVLRLFAALTPVQQRAMRRGQSVPAWWMTRAQQTLFVTALRNLNDHMFPALDLSNAAAGAFLMTATPLLRIRETRSRAATVQDSPLPPPGADASAATDAGTGPQPGAAAEAEGPVRVTRLDFELQVGAQRGATTPLTVRSP